MKVKLSTEAIISLGFFVTLVLLHGIYMLKFCGFTYYFGVEYGNISESILKGEGFSNPFPSETGPTAWMPPLLVYIALFGFTLFGKSFSAFIFLSIIKYIAISVTLYFSFKLIDQLKIKKNHFVIVSVYLVYLALSPTHLFTDIHDYWLSDLLVVLFLYSFSRFYRNENRNNYLLYAVLLIIPLTVPSYALGFIAVLGIFTFVIPLIRAIRNNTLFQNTSFFNKQLLLSISFGLVFLIPVSIWSMRNYRVFNEFIPIKSNLWFEFYLSNLVDSDGQLSRSTVYKAHPLYHQELREEMLTQGEYNWLTQYKAKSFAYIENNPVEYIKKIATRAFNAFIFIENDMDIVFSDYLMYLESEDRTKLASQNLILGDKWSSIYLSENEFKTILEGLNVTEADLALKDWEKAKTRYYKLKYSLPNLYRGLLMSAIPLICMIFCLAIRKFKSEVLIQSIIIIYLVYISPYILVSHQLRYQRPLSILQFLLVSISLSFIVDEIREKRVFKNAGGVKKIRSLIRRKKYEKVLF